MFATRSVRRVGFYTNPIWPGPQNRVEIDSTHLNPIRWIQKLWENIWVEFGLIKTRQTRPA